MSVTKTKAPAVHSDMLPGGPRDVHNLAPYPIHVEKTPELKALMEPGVLCKEGFQPADRKEYNHDDSSPYATPTRMKPGRRDDAVHRADAVPGTQPVVEAVTAAEVLAGAERRKRHVTDPAAGTSQDVTLVTDGLASFGNRGEELTSEQEQIWRAFWKMTSEMDYHLKILCTRCQQVADPAVRKHVDEPLAFLCGCRMLYSMGKRY